MGLKFQKDDFLEKKLEEFIVFPNDLKKEEVDIERFLNPKPKTEKKEKEDK